MNQTLHVDKTNFHMKAFALRLALKQRWNANRKSPIVFVHALKIDNLTYLHYLKKIYIFDTLKNIL